MSTSFLCIKIFAKGVPGIDVHVCDNAKVLPIFILHGKQPA
jgi:hypothetical protein